MKISLSSPILPIFPCHSATTTAISPHPSCRARDAAEEVPRPPFDERATEEVEDTKATSACHD
jgi:hypothetical protein